MTFIYKAKREFRAAWANRVLSTHIKQSSVEQETERTLTETMGEYMTLGAVVLRYGGWEWKEGVAGAKRLASRCALMGGRWIKQCPFSRLQMYFVVTHRHLDVFERAWSKKTEEYGVTEVASDAAGSEGPAPAAPTAAASAGASASGQAAACATPAAGAVPSTPRPAGGPPMTPGQKQVGQQGGEGHGGQGEGLPLDPTPTPKPKPVNPHAARSREAMQVKQMIMKHTSAARELLQKVRDDDDFAWARNPDNMGKLEEAMNVFQSSLTPFARDMLVYDLKQCLSKVGSDAWVLRLNEFVSLKESIVPVQREKEQLMAMHKALMASRQTASQPRRAASFKKDAL